MWPPREGKKSEKCKFAKIGKYKYVTSGLAFIIKGGRTTGLIYGRPYISRVRNSICDDIPHCHILDTT